MPPKRAHYNVDPDLPRPQSTQKRLKTGSGNADRPFAKPSGQLDPIFGQRSVLPSSTELLYADNQSDNEDAGNDANTSLDYGDAEETEEDKVQRAALEYLKAVREEASGIPIVLSAPGVSHYDEDEESTSEIHTTGVRGGYYEDGAYTAAPLDDTTEPQDYPWLEAERIARQPLAPRDAYFKSLLTRCTTLREQLRQSPPASALETLSKDDATHMGGGNKDWTTWRWRIKNTDCKSVQLARMKKSSVLKVLRLCTLELGKGERGFVSGRLSRWILGLLARLPDRGELGSEEIGVVRELGKRAVLVGVRLRGVHDVSMLEQEEEEEMFDKEEDTLQMDEPEEEEFDEDAIDEPEATTTHSSEDDLEAIKARLLGQLDTSTVQSDMSKVSERISQGMTTSPTDQGTLENTKVTIDLILTVAGELYGQRDMLEFREEWA